MDLRQTFWRNSLGNLYNYEDLFEADAKLYKGIKNEEDCNILQDDLDKICRWSKKWEMEFNIDESCHGSGKERKTSSKNLYDGREME